MIASTVRSWLAAAAVAVGVVAPFGPSHAAAISLGAPLTTVDAPGYLPTLGAAEFYLPILASSASGLQEFGFSLRFDPNVVQGVDDDPLNSTPPVYGAYFDPADTNSPLSFILAAFLLNPQGLVDGVAGSYPQPPFQVSGDGVLAYARFVFAEGREGDSPGFSLVGGPGGGVAVPVPAPPALLVLGAAALLASGRRRSGRPG